MTKPLFYMLLTVFLFLPLQSQAQTKAIQPGKYVSEGGWGNLTIIRDKQGGLSFEISTIGANTNACELSGTIHGGRAVLNENPDEKPCVISFSPAEKGIDVTDNDGACQSYCGLNAGFTYLYIKPQPGCEAASIQKIREKFKRLYDRKAYAQARAELEPVLKNCANLLHWTEMGWIRNDLAITQYKLGDYANCRNTLQPLMKESKLTDKALREQYAPTDADIAIPIAKATRTNLGLCTSGNKKRP